MENQRHQDRNALPARRLRAMRYVQGQALQPRNPRDQIQEQIHRRRSRHDGRGSRRFLQGGAGDPRQAGDAAARRPRLHPHRPAGDDALGRRGPAREARQGTVTPRHGAHTLYIGRTDHGPSLRRRAEAAGRPSGPGRPGQYHCRHRAQSRRHQDGGLDHRSRPRGRRRRRAHRRRGNAGGRRARGRELHRPIFGGVSENRGAKGEEAGLGVLQAVPLFLCVAKNEVRRPRDCDHLRVLTVPPGPGRKNPYVAAIVDFADKMIVSRQDFAEHRLTFCIAANALAVPGEGPRSVTHSN